MLEIVFKEAEKGKGLKILCLGAHCDDIEIGCGGTILKLLKTYDVDFIKWIVFASDEKRKSEAFKCAQYFLSDLNNKDIIIYDYRDGFLPYIGYEIKEKFEELKSEINPDIIFTHYRNDLHQDHRLICDLTWNTFRDHLILEYEILKYDGDLGSPNLFVPINENFHQRKIDNIINCHHSQGERQWFSKEVLTSLLRIRGIESLSLSGLAEAFYCRKIII